MKRRDLIWIGVGLALGLLYGTAWILFMRMWAYPWQK